MRILLINPPRSPENKLYEYAPEDRRQYVHGKLVGPPLGLLSIAAAVRDHDVCVLDMKGEYDLRPDAPEPSALALEWVASQQPDIVGVTFIASEYPSGMAILEAVKRGYPGVLTVAGGLHATLCPDDFNKECVDAVCLGQATQSFRALAEARARGASFEGVSGVLYRQDGALIPSRVPAPDVSVERPEIVPPDRSYVSRWTDTYRINPRARNSTYLFTSLGCPCRCSFCSIWPQFKGAFHQRDIDSIVEELKTLDDYDAVRFADANTLRDPEFANRLFDRIEAEGIRKAYVMDVRVDTAVEHPKLVERLARLGLKVAISGFESFNEEDLRRHNKGSSIEMIREAVRIFHDNDIMVRSVFIIMPDYGLDEFRALGDFVASLGVVLPAFTILTPMPGTPLHAQMRNDIIDHDLSKYNLLNCVLKTRLPLDTFYREIAGLLPAPTLRGSR